MEPCADVITKGRGRLAVPMYDEADGVCPCTMYDVRFGNLARLRRGNFAKQERAGCHGTVCADVITKGRGHLAVPMYDEADGVCPCTMYDVRCTMYDVRCTMYDLEI